MSFNNIINQNNLDYLGNIIDQFAKSLVDYTFDKINKIISVNQKIIYIMEIKIHILMKKKTIFQTIKYYLKTQTLKI